MSGLLLILIFLILSAVDLAAVFVVTGHIGSAGLPQVPAAIAIHLAVAIVAAVSVRCYPGADDRTGLRTLGVLAALICLLTPVAGCLVAAWLVVSALRARPQKVSGSKFYLGNPVTEAASLAPPVAPFFTEPLTEALRQGHRPVQRLAGPLLRLTRDRRALAILRDLKGQSDARTHLHAQSALATSAERREKMLARLRSRAATADPAEIHDAFSRHEQLASALCGVARLESDHVAPLYEEALEHYKQASALKPNDAACLHGQAACLLQLGRLDAVPDLYGRLCALPGASRLADRLELAYFAAMGNWKRTREAVQRLSKESARLDLGVACRQFWLLPHASPSSPSSADQSPV